MRGELLEESICWGTKSFWSRGHFLELSRMGSKNPDETPVTASRKREELQVRRWEHLMLNILLPTVLEIELGYYYFYQGWSIMSKMRWGWMEGGWKRQNQKYLFLLKYFVVIKVINIVEQLKNWDYLTRKYLLEILPLRDPQVTFWCISF